MFKEKLILKFLIMKNLKKLGKALNKQEQKSISGGNPRIKPDPFNCYPGTDAACCGNGPGQCGTGSECGGYGSPPNCACV
jgi:hypothetical protein